MDTRIGDCNPNWKGGLPIVVCDTCGISFTTSYWQAKRPHHFCKPRCYQDWRKTRTGSLNRNWKGGLVTKICLQCQESFLVIPSMQNTSKYCSRICTHKGIRKFHICLNCGISYQGQGLKFCTYSCHLDYRKKYPRHCTQETKTKISLKNIGKPGLNGSANPMYKDGSASNIMHICPICNKSFVAPAFIKYCSRKCMAKDGQKRRDAFFATPEGRRWKESESRRNKGEGNPRWNGGSSRQPYPFSFSPELKKKILERDNFTCYICHIFRPAQSHIHHRDNAKHDSSPSNLITLCRSCHMNYDYKKGFRKYKGGIN